MRVVETIVPPGNWHYKQRLKSSPQRPQFQLIQAGSYDQLVDNVLNFRLANLEMTPVATATREQVIDDIKFYICGNFPSHCTGSRAQLLAAQNGESRIKTRPDYTRPLSRIENWLTRLSENQIEFVDQSTATERANICLKCPLNQSWRTGCGACNDNAERRATLIRGSHSTGLEPKLKNCQAFGTLIDLSVWLKQDYSEAPRRQVPDFCWHGK
jgi:hypothetical protein